MSTCKTCKKQFVKKRNAAGKYCSRVCFRKDHANPIQDKCCEQCGIKFTPRRGAPGKFCSHRCLGRAIPHPKGEMANRYEHGMSHTLIHKTWCDMKYRCDNKKDKDYGGRGITYDPRWEKFENFLQDMGERPEGKTLDRINVNGNYCKENCRWATMKQQQRNKRCNIIYEFNGNKLTLSEWSEITGIGRTTLDMRIRTYGWPVEKALSTSVQGL